MAFQLCAEERNERFLLPLSRDQHVDRIVGEVVLGRHYELRTGRRSSSLTSASFQYEVKCRVVLYVVVLQRAPSFYLLPCENQLAATLCDSFLVSNLRGWNARNQSTI